MCCKGLELWDTQKKTLKTEGEAYTKTNREGNIFLQQDFFIQRVIGRYVVRETDLHVPEELEDLHGPQDDVLDRLLADATQRGRVYIPCCLCLLLLWWLSTKR